LRSAANAIGSPVSAVEDARREAAIRAALTAAPTSLESRRHRRQPPTWAWGAAAAVVLVAVLIPLLGRDNRNTPSSTASRRAPEATADSSAGVSTFAAPAPVDAGDLGVIADGTLRDRVAAALSGAAGTGSAKMAAPTSSTAAAEPCVDELRQARAELGALRLVARATIEGRPVRVLAFEVTGEEPTIGVFALADAGCDIVRSETFPGP
jgi:hypothetical protein